MQSGIFITFEGGEGCGKSTQIKNLKNYFEGLGRTCIVSREPGGTPLSEKIRELLLHAKEGSNMSPLTELLLFAAARAQHVEELIKPALERGDVVILDRFYDSSTAYQGAARALDLKLVEELNMIASSRLKPHLTILLDLPVEVGLARAKARDAGSIDRMGSQKLKFYEDVRKAFLKLALDEPERFCIIDSTSEIAVTKSKIIACVKEKFKL